MAQNHSDHANAGSPHEYIPRAIKTKQIAAPKDFDLWRHIHRGSMPELQDPNVDWDAFYSDYMRAYLERDVRDLISVKDEANLRDVWFYRDSKKREIDLVIQDGHTLHPVEVKTNALVKKDAVKNFSCLEGMADYEVGFGHVICQAKEPYLLTEKVEAVPVWAI